jgi:hypothetical protein
LIEKREEEDEEKEKMFHNFWCGCGIGMEIK